MEKTITTVPLETLAALELREGDRVKGVVKDGVLELKVEESPDGPNEGESFAERWHGVFRNPDYDPTGDPRAERILSK